MKIQRVKIKEFKKLKDLDLQIGGQNIWIKGENSVGKSTFMQFIEIALGSKDAVPPDAKGEGYVWADKNGKEYIIKVEFTKDNKPKLTIESEGLKDTSKSAIAAIVGKIDFNIDEFVKLSETTAGRKQQVEIYESFMDEEVKTVMRGYKNHIKAAYDDRTETKRQMATLEGFIKESPLFGKDLDIVEISADEIQSELNAATERNKLVERSISAYEERQKNISIWEAEIEELMAKCEKAKADNAATKVWQSKNPAIDVQPILDRFTTISSHNKMAQQAAEQKEKMAKLEKFKAEVEDLTVVIETQRHELQECIKSLDPVVEGLYFDEEQLLYNGTPVHPNNISTSEMYELGVKMKMALNKDLGLTFIECGESIGNERLKTIFKLAKENNCQLFIEHVERGQDKLTIEVIGE